MCTVTISIFFVETHTVSFVLTCQAISQMENIAVNVAFGTEAKSIALGKEFRAPVKILTYHKGSW